MPASAPADSLFVGGGVAGALVRALDWTETPLGPPQRWPLALVSQIRTLLATRQPMSIFWGPELVNVYNDGFLPILGDKHPAAMGQRAEECWREAWPIVGPQISRAKRGECVFHEEVLVPIVRNGRLADAWWNYSYSPLFDDDGRPNGVLVICTEITNEVTARRQVELLAVQQSGARKQAELLRAEAEAMSRAKDDFLATVSHELRTPLNAILGWSGILLQPGGRERFEQGIAVIARNARAQGKLIDDILDVSRIITGKLVLSTAPVDVAHVIAAAVDSLRPAAAAKGVELHVDTKLAAPWSLDEDRIQQVVWNLLANAVKFTPQGGSVLVRATEDAERLSIIVTDTGMGIAPGFLPYVFERFRQSDGSTTRRHSGLGLGLAIVRHLVELHGGSVSAASAGEGCGATFAIELPRSFEPAPATPPVHAKNGESAASAATKRGSLSGTRVLVVDDQPDARELAAIVLEDAGAEVVQARDVATALDVLNEVPVSAIVSDVGMPGEDGYSFLGRVRAATATRFVPALALTAFARVEDRQRALAAGFQRHLAKPIDPANLVAAVAALIAG